MGGNPALQLQEMEPCLDISCRARRQISLEQILSDEIIQPHYHCPVLVFLPLGCAQHELEHAALTEAQKKQFIKNLLQEMKTEGVIALNGTTRWAKWRMSNPAPEAKS